MEKERVFQEAKTNISPMCSLSYTHVPLGNDWCEGWPSHIGCPEKRLGTIGFGGLSILLEVVQLSKLSLWGVRYG